MSDKPLVEKLGFKPGDTVAVEDTPDWYSDFANQNELELVLGLPATHAHLFCASKQDLSQFLKENDLNDIDQSLWLSWPKKASGQKSDLNDETLRNLILPLGWVDTKVVSVDETWSALKFVRRKVIDAK